MNVPDPRSTIRAPANRDAGPGCKAGGRCGGAEWVFITEAHADGMFPNPPQPTLENADDMRLWALLCDALEHRRRAARNTVYPCKDCNPVVFYRWAGRHLDSNHLRAGCSECELAAERTRGHRRATVTAPNTLQPPPEQF